MSSRAEMPESFFRREDPSSKGGNGLRVQFFEGGKGLDRDAAKRWHIRHWCRSQFIPLLRSLVNLPGPRNQSLSAHSGPRRDTPPWAGHSPASDRGVPRINGLAFELTKSSHDPNRDLNAGIVDTFVGWVQPTDVTAFNLGCTHPAISRVISTSEDYERLSTGHATCRSRRKSVANRGSQRRGQSAVCDGNSADSSAPAWLAESSRSIKPATASFRSFRSFPVAGSSRSPVVFAKSSPSIKPATASFRSFRSFPVAGSSRLPVVARKIVAIDKTRNGFVS